jgi:hypothetical protein
VLDTRTCEQCGQTFTLRREHARFCSARCRVAWNRENSGYRATEGTALDWSVTAMRDSAGRLPRVRATDRARAFAVISEAVWWITIVDGTLVRYHPDSYDAVLARRDPDERQIIEETLAGLRFVRNRMGVQIDHVDFIALASGDCCEEAGKNEVENWRWTSVPEPALSALPPRGQAWEASRYQAYQSQLAGHTVAETLGRVTAFLQLAADEAAAAEAAAT